MSKVPIHKSSTLSLFTESENITFDHIKGEYNYKKLSFFNIISYLLLLISISLQFAFLGSDIFTLIQIYHLKNWDTFHTITYIPILAYKIVFTVCIGISFLYFIFVWLFGFIIRRKHKIVQSFLHTGARQIDSLRSYERFCVYQDISDKTWNEWLCLSIYSAYHYELISWMLADTPRQLLNATTIAYIVSNRFTSGDISGVISQIAKSDEREAVLLSFMFFSFVVWLCFTFKNLIVIISSICVIPSTKRKSGKKFSTYCADLVAKNVSELYNQKAEIQEQEFSKRRKIPSFMKTADNASFGFDLDNNNEDTDKLPDTITDSFSSIEKGSPYGIELRDIPASHSKVNLLNNSTVNFDKHRMHNEHCYDPFAPSSNNFAADTLVPIRSTHTQDNNSARDSYVYMPAKVYEAHQGNYQNPFNTDEILEDLNNSISFIEDSRSFDTSKKIPPTDNIISKHEQDAYSRDLDSEFVESHFEIDTEPRPILTHHDNSSGLYSSRGLERQPRTLL